MDRFLRAHEAADVPPGAPAGTGAETMGYYKRSDIPFYHALADAFTICDGYHCSVIGPTDPNRLMSMSATIDPAGTHGGPLVETHGWPRGRRHSARSRGRRCPSGCRPTASVGRSTTRRRVALRQRAPVLQGLRSWVGAGRRAGSSPRFRPTSWPTSRRETAAGFLADPGGPGQRAPWILTGGLGRDRHAADRRSADLPSEDVGENCAVHHLGRERRVLRPRRASDRAEGHQGGVSDRVTAPGRRSRRARADRSRIQGPDAGRVTVLPRQASSARTCSITRLRCGSWRPGSGLRFPI